VLIEEQRAGQGRAREGRRKQHKQDISAHTSSLFTLFEHNPPFQISEENGYISIGNANMIS
jgi:hypothetical protein